MTPEELRTLREKANLSQQKLADMLGVNRQTVSRWEVGTYGIGRAEALLITQTLRRKRK